MKKEFVMRGQTASGKTEILNFSGHKKGYAYRMIEFKLFPSTDIGQSAFELLGTVTASKSAMPATDPDFSDEGLIASVYHGTGASLTGSPGNNATVINDTFMITQNLILSVANTGAGNTAINWQCKFESVKLTGPQEAVANYRQYLISDV